MFNKDYFLKRLQAGEDMNDIGEALAEAMNEAQAEYNAEVRAKEVAEAKARMEAEAKVARKREVMKKMVDLIAEYSAIEHPELAEFAAADAEDVDGLIETFDGLFGLLTLSGVFSPEAPKAYKAAPAVFKSDDAVLADFIKNFCV